MTTSVLFEPLPWITCTNATCGAIVPYVSEALEAEFQGRPTPCPNCAVPVRWFHAVLASIREHFIFGQVAAIAGARSLALSVDLGPGQTVEVDLSLYGVPADAQIVNMNLTANGRGAWPLMVHGNDAIPGPSRTKFILYGRPVADVSEAVAPKVNVFATWFHHRSDDTVERHLVDAARAYEAGRFDGVIVPANVAAEASLGPVMTSFFARFASKEHVERMLTNGATYSDQTNVLLNVVSEVLGVPRLPDEIRGILNRLRKLRNKLAHEGACPPQGREDAAGFLAAALGLVRYSSVLGSKLQLG